MNTQSNAVPESPTEAQAIVPAAMPATRQLHWSVRRELWENRSIYLAPLVVAAFVLFGFLMSTFRLPERRRAILLLDPEQQRAAIEKPYDIVAMLLIVTALIVAVFYCVDALHGERRDRSILFWKSMPVSDLTTVLAKASIPLVVLPLLTFAIVVATQLVMFVLSSAILLMSGLDAAMPASWSFFEQSLILLYGLTVFALWYAPIYGWLLLVSAWARRATFVFAVLPLLVLMVLEKIAFDSAHFAHLLQYRLMGHLDKAFAFSAHGKLHSMAQLTPANFLSLPGLWLGLAFAAAFLAGTVRLRRQLGPI